MEDVLFRPATVLSALLRGGQIGAAELVETSLRAIEAHDPVIGAFIEVDAEGALEAARRITVDDPRVFAGVPIAVKGNIAVRDRLVTMGSRALASHRSGHDAFVVRRLREAGFVIVGITKLPEFGILPTTEPLHGGPARNPWNLEHTPGGSSGGSAAGVAAGMVPLAHGNDGGGSIRIPAACCGLVGLKPSRGRVSRGPDLGDSVLTVDGALTRTVLETALMMDVLSGYEVGDATWAPRPAEPFHEAVRRDPGRLRIAVTAENPLGVQVHEDNLRALRETAEQLAALGHEVVEAAPDWPGVDALVLFMNIYGPQVALGIEFARFILDRELEQSEIEPLSRAMGELAAQESSTDYLVAKTRAQAISRGAIAFWADHDVLMTPVLAERPLRIGECHGGMGDPMAAMGRGGQFTPFTAMFNLTGQPALSLPAGVGADGLPSAIQLVGKPLGEDTLLQLAAQLETARPFSPAPPPARVA